MCALKSTRVGSGVGNTTNPRIWMATDCQTCLARPRKLSFAAFTALNVHRHTHASGAYFTLARTERSDNVDAVFAFSSTASFVRLLGGTELSSPTRPSRSRSRSCNFFLFHFSHVLVFIHGNIFRCIFCELRKNAETKKAKQICVGVRARALLRDISHYIVWRSLCTATQRTGILYTFGKQWRDGERSCVNPIPPTHGTLNIFFTLKSKFAAHRASHIELCALAVYAKGWKTEQKETDLASELVSVASIVSECVRWCWCVRSAAHCVPFCTCLSLYIHGRAKRPKGEKL